MSAEQSGGSVPSERDIDKIERLLRRCEMDARLLDGRGYKHRKFAEAYRLLALLREKVSA